MSQRQIHHIKSIIFCSWIHTTSHPGVDRRSTFTKQLLRWSKININKHVSEKPIFYFYMIIYILDSLSICQPWRNNDTGPSHCVRVKRVSWYDGNSPSIAIKDHNMIQLERGESYKIMLNHENCGENHGKPGSASRCLSAGTCRDVSPQGSSGSQRTPEMGTVGMKLCCLGIRYTTTVSTMWSI